MIVLDYKATANYVSYAGSFRMTISKVSRIFDLDNIDIVEIVEYDIGLSSRWAISLSSDLAVIS